MIPTILLVFLLFILPFIVLPFGSSYFEIPKVYIAEVVMFVLTIIVFGRKSNFFSKLKTPIGIAIVILFLISFLNLALHPSGQVFFGNGYRLQGTLLFWLLLSFSLVVSNSKLFKLPLWFYFLCIVAETIASFYFHGLGLPSAIGSLGEPHALALFAVCLFPFLFYAPNKKWSGSLKIVGSFLILLMVILSQSRSGFIALMVTGMFLSMYYWKKSLYFSLAVCFLLYVSSLFLPFMQDQPIYENRVEIWQASMLSSFSSPWIGHGIGNMEKPLHKSFVQMDSTLAPRIVDSAHNIFLDFLVTSGVLGLGAFLFLIYTVFCTFIRYKDIQSMALLIGLLFGLSFNPASICNLLFLYFVIGQAWSYKDSTPINFLRDFKLVLTD